MSLRKQWKKMVLALLAIAALAVTVGLPYAMARLVTRAGTRPPDRALTTSPADYGIEFEDVHFMSTDGVKLSGWFLGGADSDVAIACGHGLFRSRREVLDRAAFFRKQGYDTLVFDFRRHGDSEGEAVTLGYHERRDFLGAVDYLRARKPGTRVVLYGVSMGAAASLLAASESSDIDAVIADSSFSSLEDTVVRHLELIFNAPRFPFADSLLFFLGQRGDFDHADFDLERAVAAMEGQPILIVAGEDDRRMPMEGQRRLFEASTHRQSRFESFADAGHGAAYRTDPEGYEAMLVEFLESAGLGARSPALEEASDADSTRGSR